MCGFVIKWPPDSYHPEYVSWKNMLLRCTNKNHQGYPHYGGRGIIVAPELQSYEGFLQALGRKPSPEHTVDRIDPDGNYELGNVRWATPTEQANNKRPRQSNE